MGTMMHLRRHRFSLLRMTAERKSTGILESPGCRSSSLREVLSIREREHRQHATELRVIGKRLIGAHRAQAGGVDHPLALLRCVLAANGLMPLPCGRGLRQPRRHADAGPAANA